MKKNIYDIYRQNNICLDCLNDLKQDEIEFCYVCLND